MRTPMIASLALLATTMAGPADAQRLGGGRMVAPQIAVPPAGPQGGPPVAITPQPAPQMGMPAPRVGQPRMSGQRMAGQRFQGQQFQGQRWGGRVGGRWIGGVQAPGGWNAYRRPGRGFALPSYWIAPSFFIGNFASYGLAPPPYGYHWSRYYDDAVLIDDRGRVHDSVQGIGWDDASEDGYGDDQPGYGAPYAAPTTGYQGSYEGTYEVGGQRGYQRGQQSGSYLPQVQVQGGAVVQPLYPHGYTQSWSAGSGYYYPGGVTTTITVQQAPIVTTTVTEYIEETVYRAPVRRSYRKPVRKWKPKAKPQCACQCACR
ncbi:MAG: hypothetical protein B7Z43_02545 [Sphingomonas sp. 12-62-6]|nr:MAG: hypothetical protein B7Z43_02545 [Sphingomonas sp. 12-62-6]